MTDDVMLICNAVLVPYGLSHIGHHFDFGKSISYCDCTATQMYILLTGPKFTDIVLRLILRYVIRSS